MTRYIQTTKIENIASEQVSDRIKEILNGRVIKITIQHIEDFHYNIIVEKEELGME